MYFKNENPRFPDGGKMSQHFESLNIGDTIDIKGPIGHFEYLGRCAAGGLRYCNTLKLDIVIPTYSGTEIGVRYFNT